MSIKCFFSRWIQLIMHIQHLCTGHHLDILVIWYTRLQTLLSLLGLRPVPFRALKNLVKSLFPLCLLLPTKQKQNYMFRYAIFKKYILICRFKSVFLKPIGRNSYIPHTTLCKNFNLIAH